MNRKTPLFVCLAALLSLSGCILYKTTTEDTVYNSPEAYPQECLQGPCETDPFVNYTETRADFREYGELSPRDHLVSQAAAGNNISAAIPPSIENEVIVYEQQIEGETQQDDGEDTNAEAPSEEFVQEVAVDDTPQEEDPVQDWYAEEGQNLKVLLTKWSEESGWRLVWNTNRNYVLNAGAMFRGRFADVSSALIRAFARARPAPIATFYKGNRVLVVETMEDENAYD